MSPSSCSKYMKSCQQSISNISIYIYIYMCEENPVNMPDPIRKCFGYGQLWPLQPTCSQNQAGSYMPYPTSCTHFSSIFPKKAWIALRKTDLDPIWMVWSGSGETHQKASRCAGIIRSSFWQDTTSPLPVFPPSDSVLFFQKCPRQYLQNQPESNLILADCVGFGQTDPVQCSRIIRPCSGLLPSQSTDANQIWHVYWEHTHQNHISP